MQPSETDTPVAAPLIAHRLRREARHPPDHPLAIRLSWHRFENAVAGDVGHLHRAHDITDLTITSQRPVVGTLFVRVRRLLQRALRPLPEQQSTWNGANARVMTILTRQVSSQARAIESLERQISDLRRDLNERR